MELLLPFLGLCAGSQALVSRTTSCCFSLTASGGPGGSVGQLSDGQNRIGQGLSAATYCIDSNGGLTDQSGRGCILTPPTTQFQCDTGASPTDGFSVSCSGTLTKGSSSNFTACPTGDDGGYNIYTSAPTNQQGCVPITLTADNCKSNCPAAAPAPKTCPTNLSGTYEYPHLMIPISSSSPNTAYPTSYNGTLTPTTSTIFNFDIPASDTGKTCSLIFLLPQSSDLQTSAYTLSGPGSVEFSLLTGPADETGTTYANKPAVQTDYGVTTVAPGGSYAVATFDCPAGQRIGVLGQSEGGDTVLEYFQDYNPDPIGLYVTVCS